MVGWQRHLQFLLRQVGRRVEYNYNASTNFSSSCSKSSLLLGELSHSQRLWNSTSTNLSRPLYHYLQQMFFVRKTIADTLPLDGCHFQLCIRLSICMARTLVQWPTSGAGAAKMMNQMLQGISSSRKLLADSSDLAPIPSPLTPGLASNSGKTEDQKAVSKPAKVQAVLKGIKQSPKKVNLVATLVRGMRVEDALLQLQVTVKRAAKTVYQVIHSARANATHNHGLDPDRLLVAEAFVGKGFFKKRLSYHARGKCGIKVRPECRLTVVIRELTPEEEAEIARLRVHNFRKLTKRERQLVPHKLIETTPIWSRKSKANNGATSGMTS